MPAIRVWNTLERKKVDLAPMVAGKVGIYVCGLTVQNAPHLGHARSAVAFDVVRRHLAWRGYAVRLVRNITDVDDKIIAKAAEEGVPPAALAERNVAALHAEMAALGVLAPDVEPRVTEHIGEIVALTGRLIAAGHAYASGGDVYYAVQSFPDYGRLSGQSVDALRSGARIEPGEKKKSPLDFALWKAAKPGEPSWPSPWGEGRPGWHIECSAMALAHLGESFDVHGGGLDLVFPHHENEIAQSQGALGANTFARCWMHNGLLNVDDAKMSKSLGNFWLVADVRKRYDPEAIRLYLLQPHYRAPIAFDVVDRGGRPSLPGVEEAEKRLDYFYSTLQRLDDFLGAKRVVDPGPVDPDSQRLIPSFTEAMDDDFNTPVAVAELHEAAKAANRLIDEPKSVPKDVRRRSLALLARDLRAAATGSLGLLARDPREFLHGRRARLAALRGIDLDAVAGRLQARDDMRKAKDFKAADVIRSELLASGIEVMDTPRGADWRIVG